MSKRFTIVRSLLAALALLGLASPARAQTAATSAAQKPERTDRPWATGVPEDAQNRALALFAEGNRLFENSEHAAALVKYREALKSWDHPAIRYNAAVTLIDLDQPLGANENLEQALRYGDAPFNPEKHQQALTYRKLLRGQLAELKVTCVEPEAEITLDGATLFTAPGEAARWVLPGPHQLVARKSGFLSATRSLSLLPGKPALEALSLQPIQTLRTRLVRRWPEWKPWAVLGSGALLALIGVPLLRDAKNNIDAYDAGVRDTCSTGCSSAALPQAVLYARDRGHTENVVAISLFAVGGAVIASGVVLLVLNQPHPSLLILNGPRTGRAPAPGHMAVVPLVGRDGFGVSLAVAR
jgi:hypothetical protein